MENNRISRHEDHAASWLQLQMALTHTVPGPEVTLPVALPEGDCEVNAAEAFAWVSQYHDTPPAEPPFWRQLDWHQGLSLHGCTQPFGKELVTSLQMALRMGRRRSASLSPAAIEQFSAKVAHLIAEGHRYGLTETVLERWAATSARSTPLTIPLQNSRDHVRKTDILDVIASLQVLVFLQKTHRGLVHLAEPARRPPGLVGETIRFGNPRTVAALIDDLVSTQWHVIHGPEVLSYYHADAKYEPPIDTMVIALDAEGPPLGSLYAQMLMAHELVHLMQDRRGTVEDNFVTSEAPAFQGAQEWLIGIHGLTTSWVVALSPQALEQGCHKEVDWHGLRLSPEEAARLLEYWSPCAPKNLDVRAWELAQNRLTGIDPTASALMDAPFIRIARTTQRRQLMDQTYPEVKKLLRRFQPGDPQRPPIDFPHLGSKVGSLLDALELHAPLFYRYENQVATLTDSAYLFEYLVLHELGTLTAFSGSGLKHMRSRFFNHYLQLIDRGIVLQDRQLLQP